MSSNHNIPSHLFVSLSFRPFPPPYFPSPFLAFASAAPKISADGSVFVYQIKHVLGEACGLDDASDLDGAFFFYQAASRMQ